MQVCDNKVARSYPGGKEEVLEMGRRYVDYMYNHSNRESIGAFDGGWKHEIYRMLNPVKAPNCPTLRTFAARDYDLMKRFCWTTDENEDCSMYSIGSNDKWDFEEEIFNNTKCKVSTFDCIVESHVPPAIAERTNYYPVCIAHETFTDPEGRKFKTYRDMLALTGHEAHGVDYLKMDVEGYEWSILSNMVNQAEAEGYTHPLPEQLGVEFHLSPLITENGKKLKSLYGDRLFQFYNNLFLKGGYLLTDMWPNRYSTHCTETLFIKLFCPVENS